MIDYRTKLTTHRAYYPIEDLEESVESDRGRILSSPALRRLQKRTQVFALELNASIRTRLTHSLEVAQTARFIAKTVLKRLEKESGLNHYGLEGMQNAFVSTCEMAAMLHDIGNPPFGHFGEATLNRFIHRHIIPVFETLDASSPHALSLKADIIRDISAFEGNAQAIRIITKLQRLNLSYTQTLSVLKYTRGAYEPKPQKGEPSYYLRKKPGFYLSERTVLSEMKEKLGVAPNHRFVLTYIMEAADDIAYLTADLEDAVDKGVLRLEEVYRLIIEACDEEGERHLKRIVQEQYDKARRDDAPYRFNMFFTLLRAKLVRELVRYAADVYVSNHEAIFQGAFDASLLEFDVSHELFRAVKVLQTVSYKYIYKSKTVESLELQGYAVLNGLMELYMPLISLDTESFERMMRGERIECFVAPALLKRISQKQIATYIADKKAYEKNDDETYTLFERYLRTRMVLDYISGMTDDFALFEYRTLKAIS
jgi:dGTPase